MTLEHILESFKTRHFHYAVTVQYGEDVGCDDSGGLAKDRRVRIFLTPAGYLGELRRMIVTTVGDLPKLDPGGLPKPVSNPPEPDEVSKPGDYVWGTDSAVRSYIERVGRGEKRAP
jgi:hypothetical protein